MKLINKISSLKNLESAMKKVKSNKGAPGIDKKTVYELNIYFSKNFKEIQKSINEMSYKPRPVKRVYIPKDNGKKRPLGTPIVIDRVVQQAVAQQLISIYEPVFSNHSHGFRPDKSCHTAMKEVLNYLNDGYEWVIDLYISKFFDTVNQDKLISILREQTNDKATLNLIRKFMRAGVLENGKICKTTEGTPQGSPLSPVLSNIYLDKLDKELEIRGLNFVRYADDCNIFVRSEMAADRVMKSISSWLERKLFLKINASKIKVVRPMKSEFLGFTFWKDKDQWKCRPSKKSKRKLYDKVKEILKRNKANAKPLSQIFRKLNQVIRGWINYYSIGNMNKFIKEFGQWLRHKVRVVILKQWKLPRTIYKNLTILKDILKSNISDEEIFKVANTRKGWYAQATGNVTNYLLSPKILSIPNKEREKSKKKYLINMKKIKNIKKAYKY